MKRFILLLMMAGTFAVLFPACSGDDWPEYPDSPFSGGETPWQGGSSENGTGDSGTSASEGSEDTESYSDSDDDISGTSFDRTITITFASGGASVSGDTGGIVSVNGDDDEIYPVVRCRFCSAHFASSCLICVVEISGVLGRYTTSQYSFR